MKTVYLVVSIDTECDKGRAWRTQHPLRFHSVIHGIPNLLMPFFKHHNVIPTFLLSPEVVRDKGSASTLRDISDCELGTHLHSEFVEPQAEWDATATLTPQSAYAAEVEFQKLDNLTALFERQFGRPPVSFRAGRFALSPHSLGFLERLGYLVDSSVTPFRTNKYEHGLTCNYWGAPLRPYHPSTRDPRRKGRLRLLEVPVSIIIPSLVRWPAFVLRKMADHSHWQRRILRSLGFDLSKLWVRPFRGSPGELVTWADKVIASWRNETPAVLNVMFHSVEVIPGASPYAQTEDDVTKLLESLEELFRSLRRRYRLESVGLGSLYSHLERQ